MSDRDYVLAVMHMRPEDRRILMKSEAERARTYRALPLRPDLRDLELLAREGFYYTGKSINGFVLSENI